MTASEIKTELQELIAQEEDVDVLQAIRTLLHRVQISHPTEMDATWKDKLSARAEKSEADIVAGRILSREDIIHRTTGNV